MTDLAAARAEYIAKFQKTIDLCETMLATNPTDSVLRFPNSGLCICKSAAFGDYHNGGALYAVTMATEKMPEEAYAYVPTFTDGTGTKAQLVSRTYALKQQIASLQHSIDVMQQVN